MSKVTHEYGGGLTTEQIYQHRQTAKYSKQVIHNSSGDLKKKLHSRKRRDCTPSVASGNPSKTIDLAIWEAQACVVKFSF